MIKQIVWYPYNGKLLSNKKKETTYSNMGAPQMHGGKGIKPDSHSISPAAPYIGFAHLISGGLTLPPAFTMNSRPCLKDGIFHGHPTTLLFKEAGSPLPIIPQGPSDRTSL